MCLNVSSPLGKPEKAVRVVEDEYPPIASQETYFAQNDTHLRKRCAVCVGTLAVADDVFHLRQLLFLKCLHLKAAAFMVLFFRQVLMRFQYCTKFGPGICVQQSPGAVMSLSHNDGCTRG